MSDDCPPSASSIFSVPAAPAPVLVHNKFVISPPIDHFRHAPSVHLLSDSLDLIYCPKCSHIMLPTLFCDHCKVQYERRLIDFEQRLVKVNAMGEMVRTMSSGSQVCKILLESFFFSNRHSLLFTSSERATPNTALWMTMTPPCPLEPSESPPKAALIFSNPHQNNPTPTMTLSRRVTARPRILATFACAAAGFSRAWSPKQRAARSSVKVR